MTLDQLRPGDEARVIGIRAGLGLQQRLNHLGIHTGDIVRLSGCGAFRGPFLVQTRGMQIALGRGVAHHVLVEPVPGSSVAPGRPLPRRFAGHRRHRWFLR
jgi:ferrous iron transport protein A